MKRARCGNPDLGTVNSIKRPLNVDAPEPAKLAQGRTANVDAPESYVTQANTWPKKHLKWFIEEYPTQQKQITSHDHIRKDYEASVRRLGKTLGTSIRNGQEQRCS